MKKSLFIFTASLIIFKSFIARAICPVCTFAVAGGVGLSRYFGIDDLITGLWIGGLLVSISVWTVDWLKRKNKRFKLMSLVVFAGYYVITIVPLFFTNIMGHPMNTLWGVDKLLLGIVIGSVIFYAVAKWYFYLKKNNNDHAYFPFQKVAMTVGSLVLASAVIYWLIK